MQRLVAFMEHAMNKRRNVLALPLGLVHNATRILAVRQFVNMKESAILLLGSVIVLLNIAVPSATHQVSACLRSLAL